MKLFVVWTFLISLQAAANQVVEDFTTSTYRDPVSTGVWNSVLRYAHPPLANDFNSGNGTDDEQASPPTDVGDGSDGAFDVSSYARFSVGNVTPGNVITIDTTVHPSLKLTYFYLAPGWTIQGSGPNPLWIKTLGSFNNAGTIDCSGGTGATSNSNTAISPSGGSAKCGGGAGGNGGYSGAAATQGTSGCTVPACTITGGNGGGTVATNSGGGGGGGGYYSATSGSVGLGTSPGAGGTSVLDPTMSKYGSLPGGPGGGSGGGGGGYATTTGPSSGAGGGGGGGFIRITSVGDFTNTGTITASGGAGGAEVGTDKAGAGGGGAGGSIWIQVTGNFVNNGPITALGGAGGAISTGTGTGGNGASGRTWLLYGGTNSFGVSENPAVNGLTGEMHFSDLSFTIQSKAYDSRNSKPTYTSFSMNTLLPGTSTATLFVGGSSDGFVSDDTGFVPAASVSTLAGKRYFRFKIVAQHIPAGGFVTAPIPAPLEILSVTATYNGVKQTDFSFSPACGYLSGPDEFLFLISLILLIFLAIKRKNYFQRIPIHK